MNTQVLETQATEVKTAFTMEVEGLEQSRAKKAITTAKKAQEKELRIEKYVLGFDLDKISEKLAELVTVRKDSKDKERLAYWYDKNVREYKSPLFIFGQLAKGGKNNPYNAPKKWLQKWGISTKKLNGINLLAGLPLTTIIKQVALQGHYSPAMMNQAFKAIDKAKTFETKQGTEKLFLKSEVLNNLVLSYVNEDLNLVDFIALMVAEYPKADSQTEDFKKVLCTMLVSAEIAAEKKAEKDNKKAKVKA